MSKAGRLMGGHMVNLEGRHPATQQLARYFAYDHLPTEGLREVSSRVEHVASLMIRDLSDGPELTTGLRKLLEAKDCFVRAALTAEAADAPSPQTTDQQIQEAVDRAAANPGKTFEAGTP
jgi:hypothetical protein